MTVQRLRIQNGQLTHPNTGIPGGGGGIYSQGSPLTVIDSELVGNRVIATAGTSVRGGAINVDGDGALAVSGSTFTGNTVTAAANTDAIGGAVMVYGAGSALTITNSTVSANQALAAPGNAWPGFTGGIFAGDFSPATPVTTLQSVTISGNSANGPGAVNGGLAIAGGSMGGVIMAGNTDPGGVRPDCSGNPVSLGANIQGILGSTTGCEATLTAPTDLVPAGPPINVQLGALADFGGPTRTIELQPTSPAINRGGTCPATDQRGRFRFNVPPCDSGAFEAGGSLTPPVVISPPPVPAETGQRAAALRKCKKKKSKKARKKCRAKAQKLPV